MIAVALLVFAVQPAATADDYAALQQRLTIGNFKTIADDKGALIECSVTKSTGDEDLDRGFCEVTRRCWSDPAKSACMDKGMERFMQDLATRRAAVRAAI